MCGLSALCLKFLLNLYIISSFDDETMYFSFTNEQEKHCQTRKYYTTYNARVDAKGNLFVKLNKFTGTNQIENLFECLISSSFYVRGSAKACLVMVFY